MAVSDRAFLDANLRRIVVLDRELKATLRATVRSISAEITRLSQVAGPGAALRAAQLTLAREIMQGWVSVGDTIERNVSASASEIAKAQKLFDDALFKSAGLTMTDDFARSLLATAQSGLDSYISRAHNGYTLSERVYRNGRAGIRAVDKLIDQGLLSGKSAREIALSVRKYINPNVPGGMSYAALRLGRTELNNAFHETSKRMAIDDPFTTSLKWNLSSSHPTPDICDEYARRVTFRGGEAGEYKLSEVPNKPHPQCLCYTTPVTISDEEFLRRLRRGEFDNMAAA